jgi:hypothetical protein
MTTTLTFAQLREVQLPLNIRNVSIYPNGRMYVSFDNPSNDLRATKPWSSEVTLDKAKVLFAHLGTGVHPVRAVWG